MKVLCVCEHGNVRSVALAYLIKTIYKHEAIAVGFKDLSKESFSMLTDWADKIVALTEEALPSLDTINIISKTDILNVGEDIWHDPFAQELQHKLLKNLKSLNL